MKRLGMFVVAVLAFGLCGSPKSSATDLVVNGSFENPSVGGSWSLFSNGSVQSWSTTDSAGLIEIDYSPIVGGPAYDGTQSLEINAYHPEDVQQTVNGLTPGQTYVLSWAYGDRPNSGDEELQVYFGGNLVTTNVDNLDGANSTLLWFPNSYVVTATSTSEVLSFNGLYDAGVSDNGGVSFGNEVDAVSLVATPEPSTLLLSVLGLAFVAFAMRKQLGLASSSAL